jgi:hypothetical protein
MPARTGGLKMRRAGIVAAALLLCLASMDVVARDAVTRRGTYTNWGPDIDSIEIVSTFDASDYDAIAIGDFSTSSTPRPKKGDNSYDAVAEALRSVEAQLVDGARRESEKRVAGGATKKARTLLVRGRVLEMDPGSRAGRYWSGGMGGGAAAVKISGEILDAKSGKVLVRFTQRRKSGGGMRVGGGSYTAVLNACVRSIGKDIANIVKQF